MDLQVAAVETRTTIRAFCLLSKMLYVCSVAGAIAARPSVEASAGILFSVSSSIMVVYDTKCMLAQRCVLVEQRGCPLLIYICGMT